MDILMAFVDLIPVGLFLASAIMLQRMLYNKASKGAFALFSAGTILVFVAGFAKALHKILYYLNVCDFTPLKTQFFMNQTVGFVLAGLGAFAVLRFQQGESKNKLNSICILPWLFVLDAVAPSEYSGTMVFVVLMILGVAFLDGGLIACTTRMPISKGKKALIIVLFAISFVFVLGMGYLSTKEGMNDWVKEIVNSIGQGALFAAVLLQYKNGLGDLETLNFKKYN